jgi:hypothetical protein
MTNQLTPAFHAEYIEALYKEYGCVDKVSERVNVLLSSYSMDTYRPSADVSRKTLSAFLRNGSSASLNAKAHLPAVASCVAASRRSPA